MLFRVLAALVGIVFVVVGVQDRMKFSKIRSVGVAATVEPINDYTKRKSKGSVTYSADFSFKTSDGQLVKKRRPFPEELLADFENGRPVRVIYDPRSPSEFIFEKESSSWIPTLIGSGFLVAALVFL